MALPLPAAFEVPQRGEEPRLPRRAMSPGMNVTAEKAAERWWWAVPGAPIGVMGPFSPSC